MTRRSFISMFDRGSRPTSSDPRYEELLADYHRREQVLALVVEDYDRRNAKPWGRFLLWLLRKTT